MQSKMQSLEKCLPFKTRVSEGVSIFSGSNFLCQQNYISGCIISSGSQQDLICAEGHCITLSAPAVPVICFYQSTSNYGILPFKIDSGCIDQLWEVKLVMCCGACCVPH